jgi:NTE family protein
MDGRATRRIGHRVPRARSGRGARPVPKFALVLGGGGARGFVHAGVLRGLEQWGLRPSAIVGVSMGAVVGTTYAMREDWYPAIVNVDTTGFPGPIQPTAGAPRGILEKIASMVSRLRIIWSLTRGWGIGSDSIGAGRTLLAGLFGDANLEDGRIPVAVSATDLKSGHRAVLRSGRAVDAVYASSALAGLIPPLLRDGAVLADGAYSDLCPVDVARGYGVPLVLAVDPGSPHHEPHLNNGLQVLMTAVEICHYRHAELRFEEADLVIRPRFRRSIDTLEFDARRECIAAGIRAVREARHDIERVLDIEIERAVAGPGALRTFE